ncbi:MAG: hypothetical protein ABJE66_01160 [Deltaproteobacteria bacterium]
MKLRLTSNGITNPSIHRALVELLGKPIADANALFVPTGMYPYTGGAGHAWQAIAGKSHHPFSEMGWKSFGNLELSVLPSIDKAVWQPAVARFTRPASTLRHYLRIIAQVVVGVAP